MKNPLEPDRCARLLRAIADPDRLRIIQSLRKGSRNVSDLTKDLQAEMVNISHHLGVLRNAGLVQVEKQGRFVVYSLDPEIFQNPRPGQRSPVINFGCCRLEIPESVKERKGG
jgi:ArsR family transcriptional regulator, nickel/cobalt-responsive transcriptional repressor